MVILDPVSASIDLKLDAHRDQDVRVVTAPSTSASGQGSPPSA
jgi:hypothetical protein